MVTVLRATEPRVTKFRLVTQPTASSAWLFTVQQALLAGDTPFQPTT